MLLNWYKNLRYPFYNTRKYLKFWSYNLFYLNKKYLRLIFYFINFFRYLIFKLHFFLPIFILKSKIFQTIDKNLSFSYNIKTLIKTDKKIWKNVSGKTGLYGI